jgi:Mor family transcriptional regulator
MNLLDKNIKLTIDDLPNEDLVLVAKSCGIEVATQLMVNLQGLTISIPRSAMRKIICKYISENYNGKNVKQLALECGVSTRYVYCVIQKKKFPELSSAKD